ncbi:MAG: hypothetical protein ACKV2U_17505, partial [Bryobacteraceae bacterium]
IAGKRMQEKNNKTAQNCLDEKLGLKRLPYRWEGPQKVQNSRLEDKLSLTLRSGPHMVSEPVPVSQIHRHAAKDVQI